MRMAPSAPANTCAWLDRPVNECLTMLPLKVFIQRQFVADLLRKMQFYSKIGDFVFVSPLWVT